MNVVMVRTVLVGLQVDGGHQGSTGGIVNAIGRNLLKVRKTSKEFADRGVP